MGGTSRPRPRSSTFDPYSRRPPSEIAANINAASRCRFSYRSHRNAARRGETFPLANKQLVRRAEIARRSIRLDLARLSSRASLFPRLGHREIGEVDSPIKTHFNNALIKE